MAPPLTLVEGESASISSIKSMPFVGSTRSNLRSFPSRRNPAKMSGRQFSKKNSIPTRPHRSGCGCLFSTALWRRIEVSMTVEQAVGHEFEWRQPEVLRLLSIDGQRARDRHAALREQLRVVGYRRMWAGQVDIQTNRFPFPQDLRARSRLRDQHRAIHARLDGQRLGGL